MKIRTSSWVLFGVGLIYIANLTAGFIEFIPDNLPLVGNVDEAVFALLLVPFLTDIGIMKYLK